MLRTGVASRRSRADEKDSGPDVRVTTHSAHGVPNVGTLFVCFLAALGLMGLLIQFVLPWRASTHDSGDISRFITRVDAEELLAAQADNAELRRRIQVLEAKRVSTSIVQDDFEFEAPSVQGYLTANTTAESKCEPKTLFAPAGEPLLEMAFVRDYLFEHGWREADEKVAAFVLASSVAGPEKQPCDPDFKGVRIPGTMLYELEVCQKHKLFIRLFQHLVDISPSTVDWESGPELLVQTWPWLPKTYILDWPEHVVALERFVPCNGSQRDLIVKGDAHGGRAVWLPRNNEELRELAGLKPCHAEAARAAAPEYRPLLVQEMVNTLLWDGLSFIGRAFLVVQRTGRTRLNVGGGRWSLGMPSPNYELHLYDTPHFIQFPTGVRDRADDSEVTRRNAKEFEEFMKSAAKKSGQDLPHGWLKDSFMPQVAAISKTCFAASRTPWIWEVVDGHHERDSPTDAMKAPFLEPDGAFLFLAAEVVVDEDLNVRLIEMTSFPADVHELQKSFGEVSWARSYVEELARHLAALLLRGSEQKLGSLDSHGERWTRLAIREPFPHP